MINFIRQLLNPLQWGISLFLLGRFALSATSKRATPDSLSTPLTESRLPPVNFKTVVENLPTVVLTLRRDGYIHFANPAVIPKLGYLPVDLMGGNLLNLVNESDVETLRDRLQQRLPSQIPFHIRLRDKQGDWQALVMYPVDQQGEYVTLCGRIDPASHLHAQLIDSVSDAIIATDLDGAITSWNHAAMRMYGWQVEEAVGKRVADLIPTQTSVQPTFDIDEADGWSGELQQQHKNGDSLFALGAASRLDNVVGEPAGSVIIFHDITARKIAQDNLRARDAILEAISFAAHHFLKTPSWQQVMADILARLGSATQVDRVIFVGARRQDGPFAEFEQQHVWHKNHANNTPFDVDTRFGQVARMIGFDRLPTGQTVVIDDREGPSLAQSTLASWGLKTTVTIPIMLEQLWWGCLLFDSEAESRQWSPVEIEALQLAAVILAAAVDRQRTEESLHHKQKLESIGLLAGGIAHDFNNLLTGILAQTSLVAARLPESTPAQENLSKAMASAEQAARLIKMLLAYAGKGTFHKSAVDINELINQTQPLFDTTRKAKTKLTFNLAHDLPMIQVDKGQIQQVIMNLLINATEALDDDGGEVVVETGRLTLSPAQAKSAIFAASELRTPSPFIFVSVRDNGHGMSKNTLERIFDPFFSTKGFGRGLGLSATGGIIKQHAGLLFVTSSKERGSLFRLLLPIPELAATTSISP